MRKRGLSAESDSHKHAYSELDSTCWGKDQRFFKQHNEPGDLTLNHEISRRLALKAEFGVPIKRGCLGCMD